MFSERSLTRLQSSRNGTLEREKHLGRNGPDPRPCKKNKKINKYTAYIFFEGGGVVTDSNLTKYKWFTFRALPWLWSKLFAPKHLAEFFWLIFFILKAFISTRHKSLLPCAMEAYSSGNTALYRLLTVKAQVFVCLRGARRPLDGGTAPQWPTRWLTLTTVKRTWEGIKDTWGTLSEDNPKPLLRPCLTH